MNKTLIIASILLLNFTAFSQSNRNDFDIQFRKITIEQQGASSKTYAEYKNLKGSPYVNETFAMGKIYNETEVLLSNVKLRYNAYSDEIEINNSKTGNVNDYGALYKDPNLFIKINKHVYVFVPFENSISMGNYFEILSENKSFDLFKKTTVKFIGPTYAVTSYDNNKPAEFKHKQVYFLVDQLGNFYELPSKKNKLLKFLSKDHKEVKLFAKNNSLNLNKEKDLIRLVSYYNTKV